MTLDELQDRIARQKAATWAECETIAAYMERYAKDNAPWRDRTSHARQNIKGRSQCTGAQAIMTISHGVRYGRYLEQGTPPHIIRPRNKQALAWTGCRHPVRAVHHPGTQPHPIIQPAAEAGKEQLKAVIAVIWGLNH